MGRLRAFAIGSSTAISRSISADIFRRPRLRRVFMRTIGGRPARAESLIRFRLAPSTRRSRSSPVRCSKSSRAPILKAEPSRSHGAEPRKVASTGGAYGVSPLTVTGLAAGTNVTIEFNAGTLGKIQFENGSYPTLFERRPRGIELSLCQRYCYVNVLAGLHGIVTATTDIIFGAPLPVTMRATPTLSLLKTSVSGASFELLVGSAWATAASLSLGSITAGLTSVAFKVSGFSALTLSAPCMGNSAANFLSFSAEL